jgi:hypothetical protein
VKNQYANAQTVFAEIQRR